MSHYDELEKEAKTWAEENPIPVTGPSNTIDHQEAERAAGYADAQFLRTKDQVAKGEAVDPAEFSRLARIAYRSAGTLAAVVKRDKKEPSAPESEPQPAPEPEQALA